jgi:hypothetical protein
MSKKLKPDTAAWSVLEAWDYLHQQMNGDALKSVRMALSHLGITDAEARAWCDKHGYRK